MESRLARTTREALLAVLVLLAACRTAAPPAPSRVPDPTQPPLPGAALTPEALTAARAAVAAAERGDARGAERALRQLPAGHPVTRLVALEIRHLQRQEVSGEALELARSEPGWATGWLFTAQLAAGSGDAATELIAARQLATLQPQGPWRGRVATLEKAALDELLADGAARLAAGDGAGALRSARAALELAPSSAGARALAVRGALAAGDTEAAVFYLPALPDDVEGLQLKGRVAETLGQWELALQLYERLPARHPGRCELIEGAQAQLRLANAPPYVGAALRAPTLARRSLAAILAWQAPALARREGNGPVVVFEDIVELPERADIAAVVRSGLMRGDAVARRFYPDRPVGREELVAVLERLAQASGRRAPLWCGETVTPDCEVLPEAVTGAVAAELAASIAAEGGGPCKRR
jgi:tetratricopeptide (TPR) repeat protein